MEGAAKVPPDNVQMECLCREIGVIKLYCGCLVVAKSCGDSTVRVQNLKRAHPLFFINHHYG
jgi:hypothetical protein